MEIYPGFKSKDQFWKQDTPASVRVCVLAGGYACIAVGVITLLAMGVMGLLDGLFMLALGFGISAKRNRACAVAAGVYYALNQLVMRLLPINVQANAASTVFTYVLLGCMVLSICGTFKFNNLYDLYLLEASQQWPPDHLE